MNDTDIVWITMDNALLLSPLQREDRIPRPLPSPFDLKVEGMALHRQVRWYDGTSGGLLTFMNLCNDIFSKNSVICINDIVPGFPSIDNLNLHVSSIVFFFVFSQLAKSRWNIRRLMNDPTKLEIIVCDATTPLCLIFQCLEYFPLP